MNKHGLVFGKFYPYHKGHQYLIRTAMEQSEHVTVVVCSLTTETIPGVLRHAWVNQSVREMLQEPLHQQKGTTVSVIHLDKTVPQEPKEHPDFWTIWTDLLEGYLTEERPAYDALFTSEDYGFPMAEHLGCKHVLVDKERATHPISGTACREEFYDKQNAEHPNFTKAFKQYVELETKQPEAFDYRFVIVGSESCGKSTMTHNLAKALNGVAVDEYGRTFTEEYEIESLADFYVLLQTQLHEFLHTKRPVGKNSILISDTDAIVTQAFADLYFPLREKEFDGMADKHIRSYKEHADLYILLKPTVKWVDDGTREHEKYRDFAHGRIKSLLEKYEIPFVEIEDADYDVRTATALEAVKNLMKKV